MQLTSLPKSVRRPSRWLVASILALAGSGAWISGQLVKRDANLWSASASAGGMFERVCRAGAVIGLECTSKAEGRWSALRIPVPLPSRSLSLHLRRIVVPVSFAGLAYFVFMAVWFAVAGRSAVGTAFWQRVPLIIGGLGAVFSVVLLTAMLLRWAPACVWCLATHGVNLVMVAAIGRLHRVGRSAPAGGASSRAATRTWDTAVVPASRLAWHATAFAVMLVGGLWFYRHEQLAWAGRLQAAAPYKQLVQSLRADPEFVLRDFYAQPCVPIPVGREEPATDDQPQLVVFTDFECPTCYCTAKRIREQISPAFEGGLAVTVRHFPLCAECNPAASESPGATHHQACRAAYAAEAARLQGGDAAFWRMHDLLFENRKRLNDALYAALAARLGLDVERFDRDFHSAGVQQAVAEDVASAQRLGVEGTPTLFLSGRRITAFGRDNPVFWQAVANEWSAARGQTQLATLTLGAAEDWEAVADEER